GEPKAIAAIVVDCSASMAFDEGGRTRMDLLRSAVLRILSSLNNGDEAALVPAGTAPQPADPTPTADLQSLAMRVADLEPSSGAADMANALTRALNVLDAQ